jgi:D-xylose transport system permease protein
VTTETPATPTVTFDTAHPEENLRTQLWENFKGGNLGSAPVIFGLTIIVIVFAFTAQNFFTAVNFNNIIPQMAGTTMLAFGVVFVLLLGEIDLSIAYLSGVAGVAAAEFQNPDSGHHFNGIWPIIFALVIALAIGAFQGSFVALIGVPAFVVTLAGLLAWQGVIQVTLGAAGPIIIQNRWINYTASYFFSETAGWIIAAIVIASYLLSIGLSLRGKRQHGVTVRYPWLLAVKTIGVVAITILVVAICNHDRGVPLPGLIIIFFLLTLTYITKRTTFGRHVYAVGGNAEAARRAGISVPRIRIIVFMISAFMAGVGGVMLAGNLRSVAPDQGGGTLLLDAISAAVIGGTSLFGGRGEVRSAVLGAAVIATIQNGLYIFGFQPGVIYITTGSILLFAVTLDTIARRRQAKTGR